MRLCIFYGLVFDKLNKEVPLLLTCAQVWFLLVGLFVVGLTFVIRCFGPDRIEFDGQCGDTFAKSLAEWFHRYQIGITPEKDDDEPEDMLWRCFSCGNTEALTIFLNAPENLGWQVYQINPCGETGRFLLVMCAPKWWVDSPARDDDDDYGDDDGDGDGDGDGDEVIEAYNDPAPVQKQEFYGDRGPGYGIPPIDLRPMNERVYPGC